MITPAEYRAMRSAATTQIEERIDQALRDTDRTPITISAKLLGGNHVAIDHVLNAYRILGWSADIVCDSRDGDYVQMELP